MSQLELSSAKILKVHFDRRRRSNRHYSLRRLAGLLKMSPAYLSRVLSGERRLPLRRVSSIAQALEMDAYSQSELRRALLKEQAGDSAEPESSTPGDLDWVTPRSLQYESMVDHLFLLDEWYYLPLLDLTTCEGFVADAKWISQRLGISVPAASDAFHRLKASGLLVEINGQWKKSSNKIRLPSAKASARFQECHKAMLKKVIAELCEESSAERFERRLILGASVASNSRNIQKAKKFLEDALIKAVDILTEDEADQVYYLSFNLIPVSKP